MGLLSQLAVAQISRVSSTEQTHFSAETPEVQHPIRLPSGVLEALRSDSDVIAVLASEGRAAKDVPADWLSAANVQLRAGARDILVVAMGPLAGANVTTFWIFRDTGHGFDLLLKAPAHDLFIKKTRTNGSRDIEIVAMTAHQISTVRLKFDGVRYQERAHSRKRIR